MNKLTIAVLAVLFAVLGGCASTGDMIGTGAVDNQDAFPRTALGYNASDQ